MAAKKRLPKDSVDEIKNLKKQNALLRKKLKATEAERESYRKAAQAYYNATIDPAEDQKWWEEHLNKKDFWIEGSLVDLLKEAQKKQTKRGVKHAG
jgi:hypothetical protein